MDYKQARIYMEQVSKTGSIYGLETMRRLLKRLGNPQDDLKFIHIAGTNGKGSVLAELSAILKEAGYLVGRYVSPTLFSYRERIQINAEWISREEIARLITTAAEAAEKMKQEGEPAPTAFEIETAVSFLYFQEKKCDYVLLETGLGGRMDATNVVTTTVLSVLASISMDHMAVLGNTLEEIAWNKAGIIKQGVPVVSADQKQEAREVLQCCAQEMGSEITFADRSALKDVRYGMEKQVFSYHSFEKIEIVLAGKHQVENAALVLEAVSALRRSGVEILDAAVRNGFLHTVWRGRFTKIAEKPTVILDGAHNPDAARVLRDSVMEYYPDRKKYFIFGVFSDKDYGKIIDITADLAEHIVTVQTPGNPRALPADRLAEEVKRINPSVEAAGSLSEAVKRCYGMAQPEDVILIFGSLSFLKEAQEAVAAYRQK